MEKIHITKEVIPTSTNTDEQTVDHIDIFLDSKIEGKHSSLLIGDVKLPNAIFITYGNNVFTVNGIRCNVSPGIYTLGSLIKRITLMQSHFMIQKCDGLCAIILSNPIISLDLYEEMWKLFGFKGNETVQRGSHDLRIVASIPYCNLLSTPRRVPIQLGTPNTFLSNIIIEINESSDSYHVFSYGHVQMPFNLKVTFCDNKIYISKDEPLIFKAVIGWYQWNYNNDVKGGSVVTGSSQYVPLCGSSGPSSPSGSSGLDGPEGPSTTNTTDSLNNNNNNNNNNNDKVEVKLPPPGITSLAILTSKGLIKTMDLTVEDLVILLVTIATMKFNDKNSTI